MSVWAAPETCATSSGMRIGCAGLGHWSGAGVGSTHTF